MPRLPRIPPVRDHVDGMLDQWSWAPYELPMVPMAIAKRVVLLARRLDDVAAEALTPYGLERAEFDVLVTLLRSGPSHELAPTRLNHYLDLSSGGLTKRLTRLERRELVTRRLDPADRRSLLVALSPEGKALTETAVGAHTAAVSGLVAALPGAEQEHLADLLRTVVLGSENRPE